MAEQNAQGVEPAVAGTPAPQPVVQQPVAQPVAQPQQPQPQQGWGTQPVQNGFAQPQPVAQPVMQQPEPVSTVDNDRTRQQFEKLTDTNQRLANTNELLRQELIALQQQRQQGQSQQYVQQNQQQQQQQVLPGQQQSVLPKLSDYIEIDPVTGERVVNETRFNAAMAEIYQKASRAEEVVKNYVSVAEQREIERNERETFQSYPHLNPRSANFDQQLAQTVQAHLLNSMVNPQMYGGRAMSLKEAADFVTQQSGGRPSQSQIQAVPTPAVNEANQVQKEQAAVSMPSVPQQVTQNVDTEREYQRLVQGTRLGSDEAIALRLKNSTHRIEDVERQGI